jgi:hypothetical protein
MSPLLSNPRAPTGISRKKLAELLLDTHRKVLRQAENQPPRGAAGARNFSLNFTCMTHERHTALKFEKKRPDFLKFAVYGTRNN